MRILVVSVPLQRHLLPLIPFAGACRDAGHDVVIASGGEAMRTDLCGLRGVEVGAGFNLTRSALRISLRHPLVAARELAGRAGHDMVGKLFGDANAAMIKSVVELAERARPDVIVYESLSEVGAVAAGQLGVPSVLQENTLWAASDLFTAVRASPALRDRNIPAPDLTITTTPPSVAGGARPGQPMRAVPWSGGGSMPQWLLRPGERPRIVVSRSTIQGPNAGDPSAAIIAAADRVDNRGVARQDAAATSQTAVAGPVRTRRPRRRPSCRGGAPGATRR